MSPNDTSLEEEEGADVDGTDRDGAEWEGRAAKSIYCDLNRASLCLTVAASMTHLTEKWVEEGKGTEKWRKTLMIAEGKISLSRVTVSLNTSIRERINVKENQ